MRITLRHRLLRARSRRLWLGSARESRLRKLSSSPPPAATKPASRKAGASRCSPRVRRRSAPAERRAASGCALAHAAKRTRAARSRCAFGTSAERGQAAARALQIADQRALMQARTYAPAMRDSRPASVRAVALGPGQQRAVRVGGIDRGQHLRACVVVASACVARAGLRPRRAARTARRRGPPRSSRAECGPRLPSPSGPRTRRRSRPRALGVRDLARHDAVALEQRAGQRGAAIGVARRLAPARAAQRPTPLAARQAPCVRRVARRRAAACAPRPLARARAQQAAQRLE